MTNTTTKQTPDKGELEKHHGSQDFSTSYKITVAKQEKPMKKAVQDEKAIEEHKKYLRQITVGEQFENKN